MTPKALERLRRTAESNGCRPRWYEPWGCYTCTCDGNTHGCDSQCSVIDAAGANRQPEHMRMCGCEKCWRTR